jgi:hypothetical protein
MFQFFLIFFFKVNSNIETVTDEKVKAILIENLENKKTIGA